MSIPPPTSRSAPVRSAAAAAEALEQIAVFIERACQAEELDERLELDDASGAAQHAVEAINAFLDKLWAKEFQLAAKQEMLEKVVEIRTNEVHEILDNVNTGFLLTLSDETVFDNYSRSCVDIFGVRDLKGKRLSELVAADARARQHFAVCYQQIFDGFLPPHVSAGQLPAEFSRGDRTYNIQGTPIVGRDGAVTKVFFTIHDTTELRKVEAENAVRQALLEIVRQRDTFRAFLHETAKSFHAAREAPSQVRYRALLHTTKGNLGCYGLHEIAALVHSIEDAPEITASHLQRVEDSLKRFIEVHRAIIGVDYPDARSAERVAELDRLRPLLDAVVAEGDRAARQAAVDEYLRRVSWVPAGALLAPLRALVDRVSKRLEKDVALEVTGHDVLVDPDRAGAVFSNLTHLVRNSLDHGVEAPDQRGAKPARARLCIACSESADAWRVDVIDDGRGVDVDALVAAAVARGAVAAPAVAAMSREDQLRLMFLDGVTTRASASEESGRGVGAAALMQSLEAVGGSARVTTAPGVGTTVSVRIPRAG